MGLGPTQGDEKRLESSHHFPCSHNPPLCHPERSRGICSSTDLSWKRAISPRHQSVTSTGGAMGLWPTQGDEKRLGSATTLHQTAALPFVIPSEAEGSAVPRTLRGSVESSLHTELSSRPWESWACGPPKVMKNTSVQQPLSMEPSPFPLSSRAQPRDLQFHPPPRRCPSSPACSNPRLPWTASKHRQKYDRLRQVHIYEYSRA